MDPDPLAYVQSLPDDSPPVYNRSRVHLLHPPLLVLLRTFGGLSLEAEPGADAAPTLGPRRLALLAVVAAAGARGITREAIIGILWPETDEEQARHTLSQTLYLLRRDTGCEWITGTTLLRLHDSIKCDVRQFQDALNANDFQRAALLYSGAFLDGFYLPGAPQFEQWVEETRARYRFTTLKALETLARQCVDTGAPAEALTWWRRLSELDPFSATYAAGQMRALIACGDQAGALRFARDYETRLRHELDVEPDPIIAELTNRARATPPAAAATRVEPVIVPAGQEVVSAASSQTTITRPRRNLWFPASVLLVLLTIVLAWRIGGTRAEPAHEQPFLAVGAIQARDTAALGPVLRDMLSTNLARVQGVQVVSNSRLVELLPRSAEFVPGSASDAARRAGASEIVEGELGITAGELILTLRRVALQSGVVQQGYTVRAADLYALTDSATAAIARDLRLDPPPSPLANVRTTSAVAYALYEEGLRAYYGAEVPTAFRFMSAALERDSSFALAAFYARQAARLLLRHDDATRLLPIVKRLAARTVDQERLYIQTSLATEFAPVPVQLALARELTSRFPRDPDAQMALGAALSTAGERAASIAAYNRAVAIDSAAGAATSSKCRICTAIYSIAVQYMYWDSVAAAVQAANRLTVLRPHDTAELGVLVEPLLRQGRRAEAEVLVMRVRQKSVVKPNFGAVLDRDLIRAGRADELEARLVNELSSSPGEDVGEKLWLLTIALRNQGRLAEAEALAADGKVPGSALRLNRLPDELSLAIIAFEGGQPREAARLLLKAVQVDRASNAELGSKSRMLAWHMTLAATALAGAGDTTAVRALADSVKRIGAQSSFGRDPVLNHFLLGLLLQRQGRHAEAVEAFERSLTSVTDGYTRTNLEMARSLMTLRRYREAIAILQPTFRGGVDGSNTYVTHTELRFALAQAFDAAGQQDSAAVYYRAVERSWRHADPQFRERYIQAKTWAAAEH